MDQIKARAKPAVSLSYRSAGSGPGISDFANTAGAGSDFGCADFPMPASQYAAMRASGSGMLHVPFALSTVSFFHNIPGLKANNTVQLSCSILANIFQGDITDWTHPDILQLNPWLEAALRSGRATPVLRNSSLPKITVVHRGPGASTTYGITNWFAEVCPTAWRLATGPTIQAWPSDSITASSNVGMVQAVSAMPYSIGYIESGQGVNAGLAEIAILAGRSSPPLTSSTANFVGEDIITSVFPSDQTADWSGVNLINTKGDRTWPLTLVTYLFVGTNLTPLKAAGGLLRLFLDTMLNNQTAALMPTYALRPLPFALRDRYRSALASQLTLDPSGPGAWVAENSLNVTLGNADYVVSALRSTYVMESLQNVDEDMDTMRGRMRDIFSAIQANAVRLEEDRRRLQDLAATVEQQRKQLADLQAALASGGGCNCSGSGSGGAAGGGTGGSGKSGSKKKKTGRK